MYGRQSNVLPFLTETLLIFLLLLVINLRAHVILLHSYYVLSCQHENSVEGFIMDSFCIDLGTLLDNSDVETLEGPEQHSVHWYVLLILVHELHPRPIHSHHSSSSPIPPTLVRISLVDVGVCRDSDFTILAEPAAEGEMYTVAYKVDNSGKETLIQLARDAGDCSTCTGGGTLKMGFRAEVTGIITDARSPPTLQVIAALPSNGREAQACLVPTESPSMAPSKGPVAPETEDPTASPVVAGEQVPETEDPTASPVVAGETNAPSALLTGTPEIDSGASAPTMVPVGSPSDMPSVSSTDSPSVAHSAAPSGRPSGRPSALPSLLPSDIPSMVPSDAPSNVPSSVPSATPPQQTGPTVNLRVVPNPVPLQVDATVPNSGVLAGRQGVEWALFASLLAFLGVVFA